MSVAARAIGRGESGCYGCDDGPVVVEIVSSATRSIGCNVCREDEGTRCAGIARWAEIGRTIGCTRALKPAIDSCVKEADGLAAQIQAETGELGEVTIPVTGPYVV